MSWIDRARVRAHAAIDKLPGKAAELARKANDVLGRPLAGEEELADRRAFDARAGVVASKQDGPKTDTAPVIVYHMDKTRRDALTLTQMLDELAIPYKLSNIQEDPAAQMAVRRDSKGYRLPVVFIAGEVVGGRAELTNMTTTGELKKRVFG